MIDGHSILNRAFYGVPPLTNPKGMHINAIYGFLNIMFKILDEEKPDYTRRANYFETNLIYSHYNVGNARIPFGIYSAIKDRRLQGDLLALGAKYGYSWILARDWCIEAEAGVAVGYAWFKEYDCDHCGTYFGKGDRIFLLPQLGINVVYIIN